MKSLTRFLAIVFIFALATSSISVFAESPIDLTNDYIDPFTTEWYGISPTQLDNNYDIDPFAAELYGYSYAYDYTIGTQRINVANLPTYFEWDKSEVMLIQEALNNWAASNGHDRRITVDGVFGPATSTAVKYFQHKNGLAMDGVLGPKTLKKLGLSGQLSEQYYFYNVNLSSIAPSSKSDYMLEVSLPDRKVRLYQWNSLTWEKVAEISCTIGKDSTPTPSGKFSIGDKKKRLSKYPEARYCTNFYGGYYFHTTLSAHESTGRAKSHGCIRLRESTAKWIYENLPKGTPVIIHDRPSYAD